MCQLRGLLKASKLESRKMVYAGPSHCIVFGGCSAQLNGIHFSQQALRRDTKPFRQGLVFKATYSAISFSSSSASYVNGSTSSSIGWSIPF